VGLRDLLRRSGDEDDVSILGEDDAAALERVRAAGPPDQPQRVVHRLRVPTAEAAEALAAIVRNTGHDAAVEAPDGDGGGETLPWRVVATGQVVLDEQRVANLRTLFEELAAEHGGEYDGWDASPA
jgi:hypothetical protein